MTKAPTLSEYESQATTQRRHKIFRLHNDYSHTVTRNIRQIYFCREKGLYELRFVR